MKKIKDLSNSYKAALCTAIVGIIGFIATTFFFFVNRIDVPLGILLGTIICSGFQFLTGYGEYIDDRSNGKTTFSLVVIILRFVVIIAVAVVISLMYFLWNLPIFNLFGLIGMYTISIVFLTFINLTDR